MHGRRGFGVAQDKSAGGGQSSGSRPRNLDHLRRLQRAGLANIGQSGIDDANLGSVAIEEAR
ncbi:hypothetical protein [Novosphingobium sp. JCM 18896]|uniref:hypothetical protein n=1 Tax=Novosphingobium sp. JCM 18896 TaxID=2989731 RepID=UPI0022225A88|nr:hypothetical protein [Novosphingobium sp. JCM 18896]MCW1431665.1 hypothetical protein [Novosphingobium sp. JCM 18896]